MKIATLNINNVNKRLANLLAWLRAAKPDVVGLQELKAAESEFPAAEIERAGYGAVWSGQKSWNGVAILARGAEPIVTRVGLPGDPADTQARYIEAAVNGVIVTSLYAPNGNPQPGPKFDYKLAWHRRLNAHAHELFDAGVPVVLAGDYNVVPTDFDIYPTKSYARDALLQPETRTLFRQLLEQGWMDALRKLHPDTPMFTFWDYMRNRWPRDAGLRLDHLLLSKSAARRLVDAGVDRDVRGETGASDHAPAWVVLRDAAARRTPEPRKSSARKVAAGRKTKAAARKTIPVRKAPVRKAANAGAGAPAVAGDRRRFVRASRLSRAAEDHHAARRPPGGRHPRLCQHAAALLRDGAAARRAGRLGHARRADLSAQGVCRVPERARV